MRVAECVLDRGVSLLFLGFMTFLPTLPTLSPHISHLLDGQRSCAVPGRPRAWPLSSLCAHLFDARSVGGNSAGGNSVEANSVGSETSNSVWSRLFRYVPPPPFRGLYGAGISGKPFDLLQHKPQFRPHTCAFAHARRPKICTIKTG